MKTLLLFSSLLCLGACYVDYSGDQVLRVEVQSINQFQLMQELQTEYDFWHETYGVGHHADIHVPKGKLQQVTQFLNDHALSYRVMIEDVGALIDSQKRTQTPKDSTRLDYYRTLEEIEAWIDQMDAAFPDLVTVSAIASSYEGRTIRMMKISSGGDNKPAFWMDSGIHSREWVAPAANIYYTQQLLEGFGSDSEITEILNQMDIYVVPIFNVDGYAYTWTDDRLWRKTRKPNQGSACVGTDPNRNWDIEWNTVAAGGPCTQTYPGDSVWSEIEVREVAEYIDNIPNLMAVFAIHSYGQMYMVSYGYSTATSPDYAYQMQVCNDAIDALTAVNGVTYRCNSLVNLVGLNSGSVVDYYYVNFDIKLSFGVELRDTGTFGFLLPENQIIPTAEENFEAMKVFMQAAIDAFNNQE